MSGWISVDESLPVMGQQCLILMLLSSYSNIESGKYKGDGKWIGAWCDTRGADCTYKVSHWMPRPDDPSE